ncbi:MAG: DNA polymerase III subunit delta [Patescibacteria group bacterium]|jgi:DNA polymerase-3 subunit delta|nr:DNA polymerase III subunit delta [Patescibacteria group bacterium]MDD4466275.1 DNA polymerase III subunit delta [Patescibacteria group bacterium]
MIIFLYGPDSFRRHQKLQELREHFIKTVDSSAQNVITIDGSTANIKELSEKIGTGSLFVRRRLIIIRDLLKNKNQTTLFSNLLKLLPGWEKGKPEEQNIIIFNEDDCGGSKPSQEKKALLSWLKKQPFTQEFKPLSTPKTISFIQNLAKNWEREIDYSAAQTLINRTSTDLWRLQAETHRLAFSLPPQGKINSALIKEIVNDTYEQNIFALTDAVASRQGKKALNLLEEQFIAGLSEEYILSMLIRQFKILCQIKGAESENLSATEIGKKTNLHPFVIKKGLSQAQAFSNDDLKKHLDHLILLDFSNKTGTSNLKIALSLFVGGLKN